jgi:4-carboxymuconolactone decarboxylase
MRLSLLKPAELDPQQKAVYNSIREVTDAVFSDFKFMKENGELIGPFNAMLHFPHFGAAAWAMNKTMYDHTKLPKLVLQLCVLVTGAHMKARYQIFGHEQLAADAGVPLRKIATLAAGQRPADLSPEESVAFDVAYALNQGGPIAESTYRAGEATFGREGMAEIIFLIGTFHLIAIILNGYDVSVPGREEGLG